MTVRIALAQVTAEPYAVDENRALSVRAATAAFDRGADLVVLPEMIVPGYVTDAERLAAIAEPIDGPTLAAWRELARDADGYIVGGFCERVEDDLYNTAVAVGGDGVVLHYRKVHLFADEKAAFSPGDRGFPVAHTPLATIGLCVCYDLRFVEAARILALRGAGLIVVPTAWVGGFDRRRPANGPIEQVRGAAVQANLDQVHIACASRVGADGDLAYLGSSCILDPYGAFAWGPASDHDEELAVVELDLAQADHAQRRGTGISPREDRRTDVYDALLGYDEGAHA